VRRELPRARPARSERRAVGNVASIAAPCARPSRLQQAPTADVRQGGNHLVLDYWTRPGLESAAQPAAGQADRMSGAAVPRRVMAMRSAAICSANPFCSWPGTPPPCRRRGAGDGRAPERERHGHDRAQPPRRSCGPRLSSSRLPAAFQPGLVQVNPAPGDCAALAERPAVAACCRRLSGLAHGAAIGTLHFTDLRVPKDSALPAASSRRTIRSLSCRYTDSTATAGTGRKEVGGGHVIILCYQLKLPCRRVLEAR